MTDKTPLVSLTRKDFTIEWFSGQGAGGQHRNKHQNCCRIIHNDTGISAVGQNSRSRVQNQREALENLVHKILPYILNEHENKLDKAGNISDDVIRTYHAERNVVHDHLSGLKTTYKETLKRGLDQHIKARRKQSL